MEANQKGRQRGHAKEDDREHAQAEIEPAIEAPTRPEK